MHHQVIYLMSGKAHLPYLAVSLYTLRDHWPGDVIVYAWPESYPIVKRIAEDEELNIECRKREPTLRRKDGVKGNAQFIDKILLMQELDTDVGLYIDADTMINGDFTWLFKWGYAYGFCATQFNNWVTNSGMPKKRIQRLVGVKGINQQAVERVLTQSYPSVNGGVFACAPDSPHLRTWYNWTMRVKDIFIADETALHPLIALSVSVAGVGAGGKYNCSPKFQPKYLPDDDVRIWHFHGDSCVRPNKSPKAVWLWWPVYQECLERNVGYIQEWIEDCKNCNKHFRKLLSQPENVCFYCGREEHAPLCPLNSKRAASGTHN